MISYDNKEIPAKEDDGVASIKKSQSNIAINQQVNENPTTKSTTSTETATTTNSQGMFRSQFQQKTKILRDAWADRKPTITKENSKLFTIVLLTVLGVCCNIAAISSNRWSCDSNISFGLWTTCYQPITDGPLWESNSTRENETESLQPIKCAKQGLRWVEIELAQQSRIDQVYASQGLLVAGCIFYFVSLFTVCLAYWFHQSGTKLNQLRNTLVASVSIQFVTFFFMLIGLYLFILTEQFSISVGLLFVYFGLAMFASNTINFITVEYKTFKARLQASS